MNRSLLEKQIQGITPGLKLLVYHNGKKRIQSSIGKTYSYYDWASITKAVFTATATMKLYERDSEILNKKVNHYCHWFKNKNIYVQQLMNHTSGLYWWRPFYKKIDLNLTPQERWQILFGLIRNEKPKKNSTCVYSDINYFLLGGILEQIYNKPLYEIWREINQDLELPRTDFHQFNKPHYRRSLYAPTEVCQWRKKRLQGEAHDENTWALGGVSTHSGLFGPIEDLADWGLRLRSIYYGKNGFLKTGTVKKFFSRSVSEHRGNWATGFMLPAKIGSSAGDLLSRKSIGFLGFTGTSFWFDPRNDLLICLFTNRVYYGRNKTGIFGLRKFTHEYIFKELMR